MKKLKIGVLTLPIATNYGGILQAVALIRFLEQKGHDVTLIHKRTEQPLWKRLIADLVSRIPGQNIRNWRSSRKMAQLHRAFIELEIRQISPPMTTTAELASYAREQQFDAVIVGSDQVWRKSYIKGKYYLDYFLDFLDDEIGTKRISYAASFGTAEWEGTGDEQTIKALLDKFDAISVREKSGIAVCKEVFGQDDVASVLDPALLLLREVYEKEILAGYSSKHEFRKPVVTYFLDESTENREFINRVLSGLRQSKDAVEHLLGFRNRKLLVTIPEWLAAFLHAEFVITDSFHGMLFSIIFEKPFLVIGNVQRGLDRFESVLIPLGLNAKLLSSTQIDIVAQIIEQDIDYDLVNKWLNVYRNQSINFLNINLR